MKALVRPVIAAAVFLLMLMVQGKSHATELLVYDSGDHSLTSLLNNLGYSYDLRSASNPVTSADLSSHKALVVGWFQSSYSISGLSQSVLASGITGNVLLTGHDPDYHGANSAAARAFLENSIKWAAAGTGAGLVTFGDPEHAAETYLPSAFGVTQAGPSGADAIASLTAEALATGIYGGLSASTLSGWEDSYHNTFESFAAELHPFELDDAGRVVSIGRSTITPVPEPATFALLGAGFAGVILWRRKKR